MSNPFKVGDKVRLKHSEENQLVKWVNLSYSEVYEVSETFDNLIILKEIPDCKYRVARFELAIEEQKKMKDEQLYFLLYYGKKGLYSASGLNTNEIISELNHDKPEKKDICLYRWFPHMAPKFLYESEWPFTVEEVVQTVFKTKK